MGLNALKKIKIRQKKIKPVFYPRYQKIKKDHQRDYYKN
jgi:hypothetical protein